MCHAKPRKRSRLLLSEIDHCLEPFFEGVGKISMPSPTATAAAITEGSNTHPQSDLDNSDCQHQLRQSPPGGSGPGGTDADLGGEAASQSSDNVERSQSPATMGVSIDDEVATAPPDPPPKQITRTVCRSGKRIRFTGAMGKFLDGSGVWSDFAVMEAERRANSATATTPTAPPTITTVAVENSHHQEVGGETEQTTTVEQEEGKQSGKEEEGKGGREEEKGEKEEKSDAEGKAGEDRSPLAGAGVSQGSCTREQPASGALAVTDASSPDPPDADTHHRQSSPLPHECVPHPSLPG